MVKNSKKDEESAKKKVTKRKKNDDSEHEPGNQSLDSPPPKKKRSGNADTEKNGNENSISDEKGSRPSTLRDSYKVMKADRLSDYDSCETMNVSTSACSEAGFACTNELMRSVLMHPIGLPLLFFFYDALNKLTDDQRKSVQSRLPYVKNALTAFRDDNKAAPLRQNVFGATVLDWLSGETKLKQKLFLNIKHCNIVNLPLEMDMEKSVTGSQGEKGYVDYIFFEKNELTSKSSIVALFEFGLQNSKWWTKQDQILKYVRMLRTKADHNHEIDQPMLLVVITINNKKSSETGKTNDNSKIDKDAIKGKKEEKKEKLNAEDISTLESNLKKMTPELKIRRKVRFGVFLCTPTTFVLRYSGDTPQKNLMMHPHNSEGFFMEFNCARI